MARQIPYLHARRMKDGRYSWHWKPSPRLRREGWSNRALGITANKRPTGEVLEQALALNAQVEAWEQERNVAVAGHAPPPRSWTFTDLLQAYRASPAFALRPKGQPDAPGLAASTRREYEVRLGQLEYIFEDGRMRVADIDRDLVLDIRKGLLAPAADGTPASPFKAASTLRVLKLLLHWARIERLIDHDPMDGVEIPTPPARAAKLDWRGVCLAADAPGADALGARALRFGFWTMQRRGDLSQLNRFQWRELHGADPRDVPALVNDRGQVMGFRLQQGKTGRWVDCPLPPFLHAEVEAAFDESQWLFPHSLDPAKHISGDVMRRKAKPLLDAAGFDHIQLRDMRRSGMSGVKDMGALKSDIFAISGHPLDGQRRTMADVYMPPDTRAACAAIAAAERTRRLWEQREQENAQ